MRRLPVFILALLVGLTAVGCDSNEDDSDADVFIGTWALVSLMDGPDGDDDKTAIFGQIANSFTATFNADNTFSATVDYVNQPTFNLAGTYQLDEATENLILTVGTTNPGFKYEIVSDSRIRLTAPAAVVNGIFQTELYSGTVNITFDKQ